MIAAVLPLLIPIGKMIGEKLLPVILDGINGVKNPDLNRPLNDFLSDVDFQKELAAARQRVDEAEAAAGIPKED